MCYGSEENVGKRVKGRKAEESFEPGRDLLVGLICGDFWGDWLLCASC